MYCQLEALRHCLPPSVRGILEQLPETLDETYERVLRDINKANREHACRLLQCLTVAVRPLCVEELAEVLAICFDAPAYGGIPHLNPNWRWADRHQAVLSTCSSLISIVDDGDSKVVQFSHFSVKEFLTSDRLARSSGDVSRYHILLEPAHTILAQACLGALLHLDNSDEVFQTEVHDLRKTQHFPLVEYSAQHWVNHARFGNVSSRIQDTMECFFDADKPHWTAWCRVDYRYGTDAKWGSFAYSPHIAAPVPLYYASRGGFYDLVERLVGKHPEQINAEGGLMGTPLVAAMARKHFRIAEFLLRNGADVDARDPFTETLLYVACNDGALDFVLWLLDHGADVNARCREGCTPLHTAALNVQFQILQILIEHGADIHLRNDLGEFPLHIAARPRSHFRHSPDIMQLLLDHGADPNARDNSGSTPLHLLTWRYGPWGFKKGYVGVKEVVEGTRLLLKHGAILESEDNDGQTPMQLALDYGSHDIVACLSEYGAKRPWHSDMRYKRRTCRSS